MQPGKFLHAWLWDVPLLNPLSPAMDASGMYEISTIVQM